MKIRFFGDSWYWAWLGGGPRSKTLKNLVNYSESKGIPFYKIYLESAGINCVNYATPGYTFLETTKTILSTTDHTDIKYNVVFFSNLIRRQPQEHQWKDEIDVSNYETFINQYQLKVVSLLEEIQGWAEQNNQQVILVGGQSTLLKQWVDQVKVKNNLHLLAQCAISKILKIQDPSFGIFKLSTDISESLSITWATELLEHIYKDIKKYSYNDMVSNVTWPDKGHLNASGIFILLDYILEKIEDLEEKNKVDT